MDIGQLIRRSAVRFGDAPAIECDGRTLSFADLDLATDRLGNALLGKGLRPGERVGVLLPNGVDGLIVYYALAKSGLVRAPLNERERASDHAYKLTEVGARAIIGTQAQDFGVATISMAFGRDDLDEMIGNGPVGACEVLRDSDAVFRLGFTGGTTGRAKAVKLSMRCEHSEIANFLIDLLPDLRAGDRMLHAAPVVHASGAFVLPHLVKGATSVIMPKFDPGLFLEELERQAATATFLVPTMIAMVLDEPNIADVRAPQLRRLCYGASPIAPVLVQRALAAFGPRLAQTYGQAEAPMAITCLQPDEHDREGSAGKPYTLVEVAVVDDDDNRLAPGDEGEVVTRGQHIMAGYWNRPDETAEAIRDGWVHTGDVGVFDEQGFLYLRDRKKEMIISGGYNVYPREIEDVLTAHPNVREAAVVGLPDERWGERVHAVVVLREPESSSTAELLEYVADRVAGYKRPRSCEIAADPLPKSGAGKLLRRAVRDRICSAASSPPSA